jgi:hypothetical protein
VSKRCTIRLQGTEASVARHRRALATLTEHFEIVEQGLADIALVGGDVAAPIGRILVASESSIFFEDVREIQVIPLLRFAPRLFAEPLRRRSLAADYAIVDCLIKIDIADRDAIRSALLEQLAAVHATTGRSARIKRFRRVGEGYLAEGELGEGGGVVALSGVFSQAAGAAFSLNTAGEECRLEIEVDDDAVARPARVSIFDAAGTAHLPAIHQSSDRLTWLIAFALARGERPDGYFGPQWRMDVREVQRVFSEASSPGGSQMAQPLRRS